MGRVRKNYRNLTEVERNRFVQALKRVRSLSSANSYSRPALAVFNNRLHMIWQGVIGDPRLFHASFDGIGWTLPAPIPGAKGADWPALAVFNNRLHMTWRGSEGDVRLFHASFDGIGWTLPAPIPGANSGIGPPGLAVFNNRLHMVLRGVTYPSPEDPRIFHTSFDGNSWTTVFPIPFANTVDYPAAPAVFNNRLNMTWRGSGNEQKIYHAFFDGNSWTRPVHIPVASSERVPALAVFNNQVDSAHVLPRLNMFWKGVIGDRRLFHASSDLNSWTTHWTHVDNFADIHARHARMNIHESSHFLPWHREMILRFERELQQFDPNITIPYWDSSVDSNPSDPGGWWNNNFLGQFDSAWDLRRALGSARLPTRDLVTRNQGRAFYNTFWQELEDFIHNPSHTWVGGAMARRDVSPRDPVFYLLHCWIDMLWARWQDAHPEAAWVTSTAGAGLNDPLMEWPDRTPAHVLDYRALGYRYE